MLAPLKNNPILLSRSIRFFRHLKIQNLSNIANFIGKELNLPTDRQTDRQTQKTKIRDTLDFPGPIVEGHCLILWRCDIMNICFYKCIIL